MASPKTWISGQVASAAPALLGTKAETLARLRPLLRQARILPSHDFSVADWRKNKTQHMKAIRRLFGSHGCIVVRSSALAEDSMQQSLAGAFHSILNVDAKSSNAISAAVEKVIASYQGNPSDQVLIQPMLKDIAVSGVMMTHTLNEGAPYYVINYDDESGKTDTITGGTGVNKTVLFHHNTTKSMITSPRVLQWFQLIRELETLLPGIPLDIEFAQTHSGELYVFQVRPMSVKEQWRPEVHAKITEQQVYLKKVVHEQSSRRSNLLGERTFLGEMTDWNPAEMIGTSPRPLASSLYRYLITDSVWRKARASMGYREPHGEALMLVIGGRPFIDIRNSFNSFLPATLDDRIGEKLIRAWLERLYHHPELHDKVEFDIAQTVFDFSFEATYQARYAEVLDKKSLAGYRHALKTLTRRCVDLNPDGSLLASLSLIERLAEKQKAEPLEKLLKTEGKRILYKVRELLEECRYHGTFPFAVIARHAFMAEALLRSAVSRGALTEARLAAFKQSLNTITTHMSKALQDAAGNKAARKAFLKEYGHLRPGTYDILSPRYDQRGEIFAKIQLPSGKKQKHGAFLLTVPEQQKLNTLLAEAGLDHLDAADFLTYCEKAIAGREYAKFIFTRSLSNSLEMLAKWGEGMGLSREEISFIPVEQLLDTLTDPLLLDEKAYYKELAARGRQQLDVTRGLKLNYLIRDTLDIFVIPLHRSAPNFISNRCIEAETVFLDSRNGADKILKGKIVCIENADPGFDWIFTRGIAGLITQFGGSNSHMAIRCAELGLPAAIGCGEQTFERVIEWQSVELNCADKVIRPVSPTGPQEVC